MKKTLLILFLFIVHFSAKAQTQVSVGEAAKAEAFLDTKFDPTDGGTINVGTIKNGTTNDCYIVKLNASKQIVWQKSFVNTGEDYFNKVLVSTNGDYIVSGQYVIGGVIRGIICRFNSATGNLIWSSSTLATASASGEVIFDIKETASGNIAIAGATNFTSGLVNSIAILLNANGAQIWARIYNYTAQSDIFTTVNQLPNGNLIFGGSYWVGFYNAVIIELNETTAAVVNQNEYTIGINSPNPLAGNFLNTLFYQKCIVNNGNVYFQIFVTNDCCGPNVVQGIYTYDQTSKSLNGNLFHHIGFSNIQSYAYYPVGTNDFIITQNSAGAAPNTTNLFVSRVTNGVKIYDRRVLGNANTISTIEVTGNNLYAVGSSTLNGGDGYALFSTINFPTSTTDCIINNADSLVITPNIPSKAVNTTPLISTNAISTLTLASTNTSAVVTNICGLVAPCNNWLSTPSQGSYVTVGDLDITGNQITVEANFNRTQALNNGVYYGHLISKHSGTSDVNYALLPNGCEITTTNGYKSTFQTCVPQINKTYHVAMVYDGNTLKFYRNGFLLSSQPCTGNMVNNNWLTTINQYAASALFDNQFLGFVNEVRIWNIARTQTEIQTYMNTSLPNPTTQVGLKGYYVFDNLLNKQGNTAFNGMLNGGATINATNTNCTFVADSCALVPCPVNTTTAITKCSNQNINLTARTGSTYSWSPATGLSATNIQSPTCSATASTTYIATIFNSATNCTYKDTINVTVNTPATVTTQPTAVTVCNGNTATFTGGGTGTGATYQWLSGPSAAGPFTNVTTGTGANTNTYTTPATTPAMNGTYYMLLVSTTTCPATVTTAAVLLTVNTVASITTQPISQNICTPQPATFSVVAAGTGLSYQWQISTPANPTFTNIAGATSASYTTGPTTYAMNGNQYRVNILSTCSPTVPLVSNAATLTIINPAIAQQPQLQTGCAGENYTFSVTTTATPATLTYQWQSSANGLPGTFTNIAGANASSYTITNAPILLNGYYYRVFITTPCGSGSATDTSIAVRLLLSNRISIVLTAPYTSNYNPAVNSGIFTTVSPVGNYIYTWKRNGAIIPNTRTATYILLAVDDEASYEVSITDSTTNCISKSNIIKTTAKTSDNLLLNQLFIYPNPASSVVLIRYNNSNSSARNTLLNIYDSKGARVYTNAYPIVGSFGNMEVNISKLPPETYMVYLMDNNGKKLAGGKLVKIK